LNIESRKSKDLEGPIQNQHKLKLPIMQNTEHRTNIPTKHGYCFCENIANAENITTILSI